MEAIIVLVIFTTLLGIAYLFFSTRNKERLALIEKGADATIFFNKARRTAPVWKILLLNLSLLLIGIGTGIFIAAFLNVNLKVDQDVAFPGSIFFVAGLALFTGFYMTKKLEKESNN
jgi:flagellar biosynthesis protein FliQ